MTLLEILEIVRVIFLIAIILFSLTLAIIIIMRAKGGFTRRQTGYLVLCLGVLFITYVAITAREIPPADWAQIMLMLVLVVVTGSYAFSASKQADASVELAKQTAKSRLMPDFRLTGDFDTERRVPFEAVVNNYGNGPAYDIKAEIQNEGKPASVLASGDIAHVLAGHLSIPWAPPDPRLHFPKSDEVQRRFLVIRYVDVYGEYEIRQPFVLTTGENNKPIARLERPSKKILKKHNLEDELP